MNKRTAVLLLLLLAPATAMGDAGVLLPRDKAQPNASILSLREMEINIRIDNGDARVFIRQIFENHTAGIQEGNYVFALPSRATISDFAVWDGPVRIPAVILERKRAEEIYNSLKQQAIDPGLLQMGERSAEEASHSAVFSAKITPIPAYGTKRLEIEYHESIAVENFKSYFAIPLRPDAYHSQVADHLWINFELQSAPAIRSFQVGGKIYPLNLKEQSANLVRGRLELRNAELSEDFSVQYDLDPTGADTLHVITHREPNSGPPSPDEVSPVVSHNDPGFFEAEALLASEKATPAANAGAPSGEARTIIILFDTSLSMQWEKLERSYAALEKLLHKLTPQDRFNLILFNSKLETFQPAGVVGDPPTVQKSLDFVRASRLRGGTNLQSALQAGLAQCAKAKGNSYLVLLSDGGATRGTIKNGTLANWYGQRWQALPEVQRPRTFIFAVGDDANLPLLKLLAHNEGVIESVLSTEPIDFKLNAFLSKIGRSPIGQLGLAVIPQSSAQMVYPLQDAAFSGSIASWVGQYSRSAESVSFDVHGVRDGEPFSLHASAALPEQLAEHAQLPRLWARARVDALLEKIEREGEDRATIEEIIRLSRKYKFVTPYTSFLAVPRALLRPRVIRPGDPVLRVRADASIVSVVALFPFGLTKPLRYLAKEDIWQMRFLAPTDMRDGTYSVRLILRDKSGSTYRESKSFMIASTPPVIKIALTRRQYHRGESIPLRVSASESTRTLVARLEGADPAVLRWSRDAGTNTGALQVPQEMAAGSYRLTVTAEDIAHNIGSQEVQIEILP